jgi:hypothetical protein
LDWCLIYETPFIKGFVYLSKQILCDAIFPVAMHMKSIYSPSAIYVKEFCSAIFQTIARVVFSTMKPFFIWKSLISLWKKSVTYVGKSD